MSNYQGVYVLTEAVRQGPDRVDIEELSPTSNDPEELPGGYFLEITLPSRVDQDKKSFETAGSLTSSTYVHKRRDGRLRMGPLWDFDRSIGDVKFDKNWESHGFLLLHAIIDATVSELGAATDRNFEKWLILGKYVRANKRPFSESHEEEIRKMKKWLTDRAAWLDDHMKVDDLRAAAED